MTLSMVSTAEQLGQLCSNVKKARTWLVMPHTHVAVLMVFERVMRAWKEVDGESFT